MATRKRIALNYQANYDFSAGIVIYIQNLIKGFNLLKDEQKPELLIVHSNDAPIDEIKKIGYPYLSFYCHRPIPYSFLKRVLNKVSREITGKNIVRRYGFPDENTLFYPFVDCDETFHFKKRLYWKPDFQEMYYPGFVSEAELNYVKTLMTMIRSNKEYDIVFSSGDSFNDYKKFFGPYVNHVHILRFVSILPQLPSTSKVDLISKYGLPDDFYFVANQFWPHKNHMLILEALVKVKSKNPSICIAFSGKQSSYRDKGYFEKLTDFVKENDLSENVRFLGFIPREDQLLLMKYSKAVIQPSLFEGWSTVIEDSKALGQFVIAGDLAVNQEQSDKNILFFDRHNAEELAAAILKVDSNNIIRNPYNYNQNILEFTESLKTIFGLN